MGLHRPSWTDGYLVELEVEDKKQCWRDGGFGRTVNDFGWIRFVPKSAENPECVCKLKVANVFRISRQQADFLSEYWDEGLTMRRVSDALRQGSWPVRPGDAHANASETHQQSNAATGAGGTNPSGGQPVQRHTNFQMR